MRSANQAELVAECTQDPFTLLIRKVVHEVFDAIRDQLVVQQPAPSLPRMLSLKEAAEVLRTSERNVRRLISTGRLRATKLGTGGSSRVLIARVELDRLLAEASS